MTMKAFTLVETLVAITVMTLATLAPFAAVQQVLRASNISHDELVASSLAQEGIEYVRFVRYTNWLRSDEHGGTGTYKPLMGLNGQNGPDCRNTRRCLIDARKAPYTSSNVLQGVAACGRSGQPACTKLYRTAAGLYTQDASESNGTVNEQTEFTRTVSVFDHSAEGYVTVTVTITWTDRGTHRIILSEDLYNWI